MKRFLTALMILSLSGCASTGVDQTYIDKAIPARNLIAIDKVTAGMARDQVKAVLGRSLVIGYKEKESFPGAYEPITISSPHKTEEFSMAGKDYTVDFYYVGVYLPDGNISREELVPVVYLDNAVKGTGWEFYRGLKEGA